MSSVRDEYLRFLGWLPSQVASDDAVRVAKIVGDELEQIVPTVFNGGQRATVLAPILRQRLPESTAELGVFARAAPAAVPWTRLRLLSVGPFRGFRYEHRFDLNRRVVLFQGPNGSGKTSLCEALEFALLGSVEEAASRRIDPLERYFRNFHDDAYVAPRLWADGLVDPIAPNSELLRFALVEKNRIEGFSRIAAHRPAEAAMRIAALFGLEAFSAFVGNFTANLDARLSFLTPRQDDLVAKRLELADAQQIIDAETADLAEREREESALLEDSAQGVNYQTLLADFGLSADGGRLQQIIEGVEGPAPTAWGEGPAKLSKLRRQLSLATKGLGEVTEELRKRAGEVAFKDLYEAVTKTREHLPDNCPACMTRLDMVVVNPYQRAEAGLVALEDLARLQNEEGLASRSVEALTDRLNYSISIVARFAAEEGLEAELGRWINDDELGHFAFPAIAEIDIETWRSILSAARMCSIKDRKIVKERVEREALQARRNELRELRDRAVTLMDRRSRLVDRVAAARARMDSFDDDNRELIDKVAVEQTVLASERRIQAAYTQFKDLLEQYNEQLPRGLIADLNDLTRDLYNSFNTGDHEEDKLEAVELPLQGGQRLQIYFRGAPGTARDALLALSEGHIRCLGLAIVLAKNIKLGLPVLIFDDAVNAIDHDHRRGLRETLFEHPLLRNKQLIITCHSPEFIKDISNQLGAEAHLYVLHRHDGNHQPRIVDGDSRHYLEIARERFNQGDLRQCLAACRQAFENLIYRTWRKLPNEVSQISVPLRKPDTRGELLAVAMAIQKKVKESIERNLLAGESWSTRAESIVAITGIRQPSLTYSYLNKGSHDEEDREDFEVDLVELVMSALIRISQSFE